MITASTMMMLIAGNCFICGSTDELLSVSLLVSVMIEKSCVRYKKFFAE